MRFLVLFLLSSNLFIAQESFTVTYDKAPLLEVLNEIESKRDVHFYYKEVWLNDITITGVFSNVTLEVLLTEVLEETPINFYLLNKKEIILIQNNVIYDSLAPNFFKKEGSKETSKQNESSPIFYQEKPVSNSTISSVRIGKKNKNDSNAIKTITGRVINNKNGVSIINASIKVKDQDVGVATNKEGFYTLKLPAGIYILEISSLGFEMIKKRVVIYNDGTLNFKMNESYESLDEVVLNTNATKNVQETITGVSRIEVEEIKNIPLVLGERDIFKVATTLPGITKAGEGAAGFNVRGGKEDQNLVLLDDGVIYNPSHFFGLFSAINPFTTQSVNIYKGSIPAQYGGRLSSVFDLETKKANNEKIIGEAAIGPVTSNVHLEIPIIKGKSGLIVGGRGTYSKWILRSLDDPNLRRSEASFYDAILKYNHTINNKNDISATGYFSSDIYSITSDSLYGYNNSLISLKWNHEFNDKNKGELTLANSQYDFEIDFDANSNNDFLLSYKISETDLKMNMKYLMSEKLKFDYGLSSKLYAIEPSSLLPKNSDSSIEAINVPRERGLELSAFISNDFKLTDKLSLYTGFRLSSFSFLGEIDQNVYQNNVPKSEATVLETISYDKNEIVKTYVGPEFRGSARYLLTENASLKASFNSTYQYIHTLSNNTTAAPTDTWKLSDLNVKPQNANQYAIGFYKNSEENVYEFSTEAYYKTTKNLLDFKVGAELLVNESIETEILQGEGLSYGIELLLKKKIGRLNGWIGYTYSKSRIKLDSDFNEERINNGEFFPTNFDKPHDVSLVSNYKFTKRFSLSTNFVYQTGRPVTYPVSKFNFNNIEFVTYSDRNKFRIPDYYRLDLSFNVEGNHKIKKLAHSFWNLSIYNVLGRNNPYSVFFVNDNGEIKAYQSSIFSVPIPTITYNFKF